MSESVVVVVGWGGDEGQKDLFRSATEGQAVWERGGGWGREIFLPMMHGSDNVPAWTYPEAYVGFVCVCVCVLT